MKIRNKILLITGGTGSFGNAVLQRFLDTDHFKEIRIFSRDEKKQNDMRRAFNNDKLKFYIGDVRNYDSIERAMRGVDYVFHAAALKQVPSCEFFPLEATRTNVLGTQNVIDAADANNVQKVICLSTDKAAYPINAMGITKALMEKVAVAASRN
jgi:UDP-glucose 4-epimerase